MYVALSLLRQIGQPSKFYRKKKCLHTNNAKNTATQDLRIFSIQPVVKKTSPVALKL